MRKISIKEEVVLKSIDKITKRLKKLEDIQNANPASDLIEVRKEAQKLLQDNQGIEKRTSKEFMFKIEDLSKREKECWKMINKQKKWEKNSNEMAELSNQLTELKTELFYIQRK